MNIHDTSSGFVCYKLKFLETIKLDKVKFVGYAFQIEMKFKTYDKGFEIVEVPVIFTDRTRGESKMSQKIIRSEEHTSELQSRGHLVCRLLLEKKKKKKKKNRKKKKRINIKKYKNTGT